MADLKTELADDPLGRGYSAMTDQEAANDLNTSYRTRNRTSMSGREVRAEVVDAEYDALTDAKKEQFLALTASDDLDPFGLAANVIKGIFGPGSTTRSNLAIGRVESITRTVELILRSPMRRSYVTAARS